MIYMILSLLLMQNVTKETIPGVTNFARIETTIACAGAITPSSIAKMKEMGFVAVFNLREAGENGNDVEGETAAAKAAGVAYHHLPMNSGRPDNAVADKFLKLIVEKGNQPAFIHCASGNRAAALWYIKRVVIDKWDHEKAMAEASALGLTSAGLKTWAQEYAKNQK
jgi:uncharacterized protein (TIGR01244 family)